MRASLIFVVVVSYYRCIRPNEQMIPNKFDQDKVQTQLKYTGVLETTRIRRQVRKLGFRKHPAYCNFE